MRRYGFFFLFVFCFNLAYCQMELFDIQLENKVYADGIASVQLKMSAEQLSTSVGVLGVDTFHISFDDLELENRHLKYTFIHCTHDWKWSQMNPIEYIEGFMEDDITTYDHSFNTIEPYIHYQAYFPNENISFTKSGNYVLFVYDDTPDNPILTHRFMVLEPVPARIACDVHSAIDVNKKYTHQDVDFLVFPGAYRVRNPQRTIHATRSARRLSGPRCGSGRERSDTERRRRPMRAYESRGNMNGRCLYYNRDLRNDFSEDYVFTHFTLKSSFPFTEGDVYVFGELTDWQLQEDAKLRYNKEFDFWETELFLKQGVYNYQYVYVPHGSDVIDATYIEGSHFQTNNIYNIYVYFQEEGTSYDRLIGFQSCSIADRR